MSRNFDGGENLEENKDYRVYRYGDDLKPGYELKVEHSVSCENVDISALIAMGTESLEAIWSTIPMGLWMYAPAPAAALTATIC